LDKNQAVTERKAPGQTSEGRRVVAGLDRKWWVLIAVGVGSFMTALDGSVVNTILPIVSRAFGAGVATIEWVVTVYLLVVSGLLLSFGRLGDMRGHKPVYVSGFVLFVLGSALSGLAPSAEILIVSRGLQAIGGAMLLANAPAILTGAFPAAQRGQALGLQATLTYLGLTTGPSLGGWLATRLTWRAVFYINVPVGLLAIALSLAFVPRDAPPEHAKRFDMAGALTFIVGLVSLLLALNKGVTWGWLSAPTLLLLVVSFAALVTFVNLELRSREPMLDLSLFRTRLFSAATASAVMNYICLYSILFIMPFYLIQGRGLSPAQAGLLLTAQPLIMAIAAPISGTLSDRIGSRTPGTLGMLILAGGLLLLSRLGPGSPFAYIALGLAVSGLGTGIFISPNSSALMGAAPRNRQGVASGIMATARNVGMVLGVGLAGAVFTTVLAHGQASGLSTALFSAVSSAYMVAGGVALLGALTSFVRGGRQQGEGHPVSAR
jgi:EmrB/QacA subfamily drug resistance transporter